MLIKHVLSLIPLYLLQVRQSRKSVLRQLGRLNSFLSDKGADRRLQWKARDHYVILKRKEEYLMDVSKAFVIKL